MPKKSILIFVFTLLATSHALANEGNGDLSRLDTMREKSEALWELNDNIRYYALPNNLGVGAVANTSSCFKTLVTALQTERWCSLALR